MSFEAELRLPGAKPYEYVNIVVRGEKYEDFVNDLRQVGSAVEEIRYHHRKAADIMLTKPTAAVAKVANPDRVTAASATELITTELGGKVIEETSTVPPWERQKPQTTSVSLFD
jgi:hypothetical protein